VAEDRALIASASCEQPAVAVQYRAEQKELLARAADLYLA
jgi:hypothetical protein